MIEHPIVFISYSWDDENHKEWVLNLANKLRTNGIDVILDRYYLTPGKNLPVFVEESLRKSNRIITVLTPNYKTKAEKRIGGVGQEFSIINNDLVRNISKNERVIPILKRGDSETSTPEFLKQYIYIDFSDKADFGESFKSLLRELYKEPEIKIPELGNKPIFDSNIGTEEIESPPLEEVKRIALKLTAKGKVKRKDASLEIYRLGSLLSIPHILELADSNNINYQIAAAISLKSSIENLKIDLGGNPNVRRFVTIGLNHDSSFLRYRITDLISASDSLYQEFESELRKRKEKEKNEVVGRKLETILKDSISKTDPRENIRILVANGNLTAALEELHVYIKNKNPNVENDIILFKARFASLNRDKNMGVIRLDDVTRRTNQISHAILSFLDDVIGD
jgi:hypothetical protein